MAIKVFDTFTGSAGTDIDVHTPDTDVEGGGWTDSGPNDVELDGSGGLEFAFNGANCRIDTGITDQKVTVNTNAGGANNNLRIEFRKDDASNGTYYEVIWRPANNDFQLRKVVTGTPTTLSTTAFTIDNATTYEIECSIDGSDIEVKVDSVSEETFSDSSITTGNWVGLKHQTAADGALRVFDITAEDTAATPTVDDINTTEIVLDAEVDVTFISSNFAGEITTFKLKSGTSVTSLTGVTSTSGAGDADMVDVSAFTIDTLGCFLTTASHSVVAELGDGTDTAQLAVTYNPQSGWEVKEVTNVVNDTGSFSVSFTGEVTDTCQVYYPTADTTSISEGGAKLTITGATQADPVVLTVVNSFGGGETVAVKDIVGMTELNDRLFKVKNPTGTTLELTGLDDVDEDGTGHTAYSSAGTVGVAGGIVVTSSTVDIDMQFLDVDDDKVKPFTLLIADDTTPDAFSFTDLTGQVASTVLESNIETITGINASTATSISTSDGMEYRINGGTYKATADTLVLNDTVQLRVTSSASALTTVSGIMSIGGVTDQWDVTTEADPDTTPDQFTFTDLVDQLLSTVLTSNIETITGINTSTPVSISTTDGMEYRINGGAWVSSSGNVVLNDTVQLRVTSSSSFITAVSGTLDIGGVTDQWDVTTIVETTAGITGTATDTIDEDDIVAGGKTIIITLIGSAWAVAGTGPIGSTADTQAIIDGMDAASSPTNGWNNEVRDKEVTTAVVRTSNTVATITLTAQAAYDITAQETITVTVPEVALDPVDGAIVATPTFTVSTLAVGSGFTVNGAKIKYFLNHGISQAVINKMELDWLQSLGATSANLPGAWLEYLVIVGQTDGAIPDRQMAWLKGLGHDEGSLSANFLSFWSS